MQASAVDKVIASLKAAGVAVACYLPDSLLKELYPALDRDPDIRHHPCNQRGRRRGHLRRRMAVGKTRRAGDGEFGIARLDRAAGAHGHGRRHSRGDANELPRRPRREQLVGDTARHDDGAAARRMRIPYRVVHARREIARAVHDALPGPIRPIITRRGADGELVR